MTKEDFDLAIEKAKQGIVTEREREAQRRSFVFGNTKIEFDALTREFYRGRLSFGFGF